MYEVYSGTRAGRPAVLILVSAGALAAALGLAWLQVRGSRALGAPVRIEGTPLVVRPPAGWTAGRDRRGVFIKWNRELEVAERTLRFDYVRWPVFQPLDYLVRVNNYLDQKQAYEPEPAAIGGLDGVQLRRRRAFMWRGRQEPGETVYRLVSTARGDEISVEYAPLGELSSGDMELFETVCRAVELDDAAMRADAEAALAHAGLRFPVDRRWRVYGPDIPEVAGLYVEGVTAARVPVWGLALFRTWLASERRPVDLLRSFVELRWRQTAGSQVHLREEVRPDGALLAIAQPGPLADAGGQVVSARIVASSAAEAVAIFALADAQHAGDADRAAADIAAQVEFLVAYPAAGVEAAEAAGRTLAALLRSQGPGAWWPDEAVTQYYSGQVGGQSLLVVSQRAPATDALGVGFDGDERYMFAEPGQDEAQRWFVDRQGEAYRVRIETASRRGHRLQTQWQETRRAAEAYIVRSGEAAAAGRALRLAVGPMFVCPPLESLAEAWVARQDSGQWLLEVSPVRGSTTTTELLTPLAPDPGGRRRLLLVSDYWPRGMVLTFDEDGELITQSGAEARFERIPLAEAERMLRAMGRW